MNIDDFIKENISILYIEDDEQTRVNMNKILSKYFKKIFISINIEDAYIKYLNNKEDINIVITDINLPTRNAFTLIKKLKKDDKNLIIIITSGYKKDEYFIQAIDFKVEAYFLKPVNLIDLYNRIKLIVENTLSNKLIILKYGFYWRNDNCTLNKNKKAIKLTKNEHLLLRYLIVRNDIVKYNELENELFSDMRFDSQRINNIIYRLHKKLDCKLIDTIYEVGYKINIIKVSSEF